MIDEWEIRLSTGISDPQTHDALVECLSASTGTHTQRSRINDSYLINNKKSAIRKTGAPTLRGPAADAVRETSFLSFWSEWKQKKKFVEPKHNTVHATLSEQSEKDRSISKNII